MSTFGGADEATYYTLMLMPPNGNILQDFGYTTEEIFAFWDANHLSNSLLLTHSPVDLTLELVESAILLGSQRALYKLVFAENGVLRYIVNNVTRQLPVESKRFLVSIGVFDKEIAAALAICRIVTSTYLQAPALASSVQPPCERPFLGKLSIVVPEGGTVDCPQALAAAATSISLVATDTCTIESV